MYDETLYLQHVAEEKARGMTRRGVHATSEDEAGRSARGGQVRGAIRSYGIAAAILIAVVAGALTVVDATRGL